MEGNILNKPRKCDRDYELNKKKKLPTSVKDKTIIVIKKGSKNTKCRCDSFHFQVLSGNRAYYSHIKWQVQLYKHSVTLSCRFFFFFPFQFTLSLHWFNWKHGHIWYMVQFPEPMESMDMAKFIVLFFALFAMSNNKLKIQYEKHQYFYFSPTAPPQNPEPSCQFCCHFQILYNKGQFISPEFLARWLK